MIVNNLAKLRKEKGYTQEYLAEQCGVSRQAIAKWESGKSFPSTANLFFLQKLLEVEINELIKDEKYFLLKRPVVRGHITLYKDMLVFMNRDKKDREEKYFINRMTSIRCNKGCLFFDYMGKLIAIALGEDKTDWENLLYGLKEGVCPNPEETVSVEDMIRQKFSEKELVAATKFYLSMRGGSRKSAVKIVKDIFDIT